MDGCRAELERCREEMEGCHAKRSAAIEQLAECKERARAVKDELARAKDETELVKDKFSSCRARFAQLGRANEEAVSYARGSLGEAHGRVDAWQGELSRCSTAERR